MEVNSEYVASIFGENLVSFIHLFLNNQRECQQSEQTSCALYELAKHFLTPTEQTVLPRVSQIDIAEIRCTAFLAFMHEIDQIRFCFMGNPAGQSKTDDDLNIPPSNAMGKN